MESVRSDGLVYGGTYPGCVLLRYDSVSHSLQILGRMSENADNLYSRMVYDSIPGHIFVSCGTADPHLTLWNIDAAEAHNFGESGASVRGVGDCFVCFATGEEVDCYDSKTLQKLEQDLSGELTDPPPPPPSRYGGMHIHRLLKDGSWLGESRQGVLRRPGHSTGADVTTHSSGTTCNSHLDHYS